jgi:hypothetical protein
MTIDQGPWTTPGHVLAAAIGLSVLDITTVVLRFIARKKQRQALKADDWLIIPGTVRKKSSIYLYTMKNERKYRTRI